MSSLPVAAAANSSTSWNPLSWFSPPKKPANTGIPAGVAAPAASAVPPASAMAGGRRKRSAKKTLRKRTVKKTRKHRRRH